MPKSKTPNNTHVPLTEGRMEELLSGQTSVILQAVDAHLRGVNRRLDKLEKQYERLLRTLNKFLKRVSDLEEEFEFMKEDLKRVKTVIREKLGVTLE